VLELNLIAFAFALLAGRGIMINLLRVHSWKASIFYLLSLASISPSIEHCWRNHCVKFAIAGLPKLILLMILSLVMMAPQNLQVATLLIYSPPTKMFTCSPVFITLFSLGLIETPHFHFQFRLLLSV
jgi:hypothetical protein